MSSQGTSKFVVKPAAPMNSDINVTPLVDVVLVLLIIFMVVTPMLEKDISVQVPQTQQVQEIQEVPPDQLVVRLNAAGELTVNWEKIESAALIDRLKTVLDKRRKVEDKIVFIIAEDGTNYGAVITTLDAAKQAGASVLGMMTDTSGDKNNPQGAAPAPPSPPPP